MATIETIFKIAAAVTGGKAVEDLGKNLKNVDGTATNMKRSFAQAAIGLKAFAGALALRELKEFVGGAIELGDQFNDMSQRTGVSVEMLGKFRVAAKTSGVEIEEVAGSIAKLSKNLVAAEKGTGAAAIALRAVGISSQDIKTLSPDEILLKIADAFKGTEDGARKTAVAMALFGKSGANLIPLLNQGSEEILKFNSALTTDFAKKADLLNDQIALLKNQLTNFSIFLAGELLPGITAMAEGFNENTTAVKTLVVFVKGLELSFTGLGFAFSTISSHIGEELALMAVEFETTMTQLSNLAAFDLTAAKANRQIGKQLKDDITSAAVQQRAEDLAKYQKQVEAIIGLQEEARKSPAANDNRDPKKPQIDFNPTGSADAEAAAKALDDWLIKQRESVETLRQEASYIGKTAIEVEKLKDARKLDAEFATKIKDLSPAQVASYRAQTEAIKQQRQEILQLNYQQSRTFGAGAQDALNEYLDSAGNAAAQSKKLFSDAFNGIEDVFTSFVETGKLSFSSLAKSIISDLIKIQVRQNITGNLSSLFSASTLSGIGSFLGFANGGVMTGSGKMPLNTYANGGVANSPQLAMFGEGSKPEAYVPLPDGKRIPVAMQGGAGNMVKIDVTVNMDSGNQVNSSDQQGAQLGALIASSIKSTLINEKRPGGLLAA